MLLSLRTFLIELGARATSLEDVLLNLRQKPVYVGNLLIMKRTGPYMNN